MFSVSDQNGDPYASYADYRRDVLGTGWATPAEVTLVADRYNLFIVPIIDGQIYHHVYGNAQNPMVFLLYNGFATQQRVLNTGHWELLRFDDNRQRLDTFRPVLVLPVKNEMTAHNEISPETPEGSLFRILSFMAYDHERFAHIIMRRVASAVDRYISFCRRRRAELEGLEPPNDAFRRLFISGEPVESDFQFLMNSNAKLLFTMGLSWSPRMVIIL